MKAKIILIAVILVGASVATYGFLTDWQFSSSPESEIEKQLKNPDSIPTVSWNTLYKYDYQNKVGPEEIMALDGKLVKIPGYIVPLTDNWSELDDFLLVPDGQACIHVPPPPPNLIVAVSLRNVVPMEEVFNPSWVIGIFRIEETFSVHGGSSYTLDGIKLEEFEFDDY